MAHIRYATRGEVSLENVHPFTRVWKGVQMCFCHNGDCPKFAAVASGDDDNNNNRIRGMPKLGKTKDVHYHPVGDTDSEAVFCAILNAMAAEFPGDVLPTLPVLHEFLKRVCDEIIQIGVRDDDNTIFNFLLGCGQYTMFAYSWPGRRPGSKVWNGLHYIVRDPPFATAKLLDVDYAIDFSTVTTPSDRVAVITTKPLTEEPGWTEFKRGELIMFDKGKPYMTAKCCEVVEREGRGLYSKCFAKNKTNCGGSSSSSTRGSCIVNNNHPRAPSPTTIATTAACFVEPDPSQQEEEEDEEPPLVPSNCAVDEQRQDVPTVTILSSPCLTPGGGGGGGASTSKCVSLEIPTSVPALPSPPPENDVKPVENEGNATAYEQPPTAAAGVSPSLSVST